MEPSFERIYSQELGALHAFLYRLGAPASDVPDLIHDTFITAIRRWSTFDASKPVRPWLLGIAWRVHADWRSRAGHRREEPMQSPPERHDDSTPETHAQQRQSNDMVHRALAQLDETKRAVFVMHYFDGLSPNEISEAMNVPTATTYSRLRLARTELTQAVRSFQETGR